MTRQHFIALADALARARRMCETRNQERGVERAAHYIADVCAASNPNFDRGRFLRAAEVTQ